MDYKEMLKTARENMPEITISKKKFEVPKVDTIRQGKKTIVTNFNKVAEYINRNANDLLKFLTRELATSAVMEGHKAIFNGGFNRRMLNEKIDKYVNNFVKCSECGRFETTLNKEDRITYMKCIACGAKKPVKV